MKSNELVIKEKKELANDIFEFTLIGDNFSNVQHGQFLNIKVESKFLRRPISIMDISKDELKITFKVFKDGTKILSEYKEGDKLNCLYPLGNGFKDDDLINKDILIVAGGIGVPPLVGMYKHLKKLGNNVRIIFGFKDEDASIYNELEELEIVYDNIDGNIIKYMKKNNIMNDCSSYYTLACGPMIFLEEIAKHFESGQMLLEERMGCGFGACMGCSKKISDTEYKRVCVEGPMFYNEEVRYGIKS